MTPKEKAEELMQRAYDLDQHNKTPQNRCKHIALLCVNEIIKICWMYDECESHDWKFYNEVKKEITLL